MRFFAPAALSSALLLAACNQSTDQSSTRFRRAGAPGTPTGDARATAPGAARSPAAAAATAGPSAADQMGAKLKGYIDCINSISSSANDAGRNYFRWADPKRGPSGKERSGPNLYKLDANDCRDGIAKSRALPPAAVELDAAGERYVAALTALAPLLADADYYYDTKNFLDDHMAKGKALHPKLVAAFQTFAAADHELRSSVQTLNRRAREQSLAEMEKSEGRKLPFLVERAMLLAETLVQLTEVHQLGDVDLPKLQAAIDAYEPALQELKDYAAAHPDEARHAMMLSGVQSKALSFLVSTKNLMRRVRDKRPYSTGDKMLLGGAGAWMVEGSPDRVLHDYNQLVSMANNLHFR